MLILTVSQLNRYISFKIKDDKKLNGILLKGEISNFKAHRSGHFYFTLKDGESSLKAVMFRSYSERLKFMPQDGMSVIVMGSVSVFERDGIYQIYVTDIQPEGAGAVSVAAEQLKERLRSRGIFDQSHKRPLPYMPEKIGIVTSLSGAALQDVINILSRRYPVGELCVFPAVVQGENASDSICRGIIAAGRSGCDVLIVGRGGGSMEDLSAFNTEKVAMCIYNSSIPVVSAVGHETDFTVSDLAADMRAPTPSAAAELVSPSKEQLSNNIDYCIKRMRSSVLRIITLKQNSFDRIVVRLETVSPQHSLALDEKNLTAMLNRLGSAYRSLLAEYEKRFAEVLSKIEAMSPLSVLGRGYSLAYKDKKILFNTEGLKIGDNVDIMLSEGKFSACVTNITISGENE